MNGKKKERPSNDSRRFLMCRKRIRYVVHTNPSVTICTNNTSSLYPPNPPFPTPFITLGFCVSQRFHTHHLLLSYLPFVPCRFSIGHWFFTHIPQHSGLERILVLVSQYSVSFIKHQIFFTKVCSTRNP